MKKTVTHVVAFLGGSVFGASVLAYLGFIWAQPNFDKGGGDPGSTTSISSEYFEYRFRDICSDVRDAGCQCEIWVQTDLQCDTELQSGINSAINKDKGFLRKDY